MNARDYGLDPAHFLRYVIRPALSRIAITSPSAQALVLGTGLVESRLRWLDQVDTSGKPGPAYGLFQMEMATHDDLWTHYLQAQVALRLNVARLSTYYSLGSTPDVTELWANLAYATAMCRVHYRRDRLPLPAADDARGMAQYWKRVYNTSAGKGRVDEALQHFEFAVRCVSETK